MDLTSFILRNAEAFLALQANDGSFPAGHNGPYYDEELPLRNTAHVLILLLKAFELSGEQRYDDAASRALHYVLASDRRPMGATFWMRKKPGKDFSNGLIGQAWVIEALAYAASARSDESLIEPAEEIFLLHPFDESTGRWQVVNVDGSFDPVDMTFNHQLWFAAAGSYLLGNSTIKSQVECFMNSLDRNLELYDNGLIVHALGGHRARKPPLKRRLKNALKSVLKRGGGMVVTDTVINKAIGYHAFNTYAFALLYTNLPDHPFWESERFDRMLRFLLTDFYAAGLETFAEDNYHADARELPFNRFGFAYNPPGIEVAFTLKTFADRLGSENTDPAGWLAKQREKTFDEEAGLMIRNTDDPATLSARVYESVRLLT